MDHDRRFNQIFDWIFWPLITGRPSAWLSIAALYALVGAVMVWTLEPLPPAALFVVASTAGAALVGAGLMFIAGRHPGGVHPDFPYLAALAFYVTFVALFIPANLVSWTWTGAAVGVMLVVAIVAALAWSVVRQARTAASR